MVLAHSICSSFEQLADESRDLSQAEKKINVVKDEQILKNDYFYSKRSSVVILIVILVVIMIV